MDRLHYPLGPARHQRLAGSYAATSQTGGGKKSPRYLLKCVCCEQKLDICHADDGLEIGGV